MASVRGNSVVSEQGIISQSIAHGMSIMKNSAEGSTARKAMADGQSKKTVIMSALCLITLGANVAYSSVAVIFPPTMKEHSADFGTLWVAYVIAAYALGQTVTGGMISKMLDTRGKKVTILAGVLAQAVGLVIFGYVDTLPKTPAMKWVYFFALCFSRFLLGFGNGCIQSGTSAIISFNFPDSMGTLFGIQNLFTQVGMSVGGVFGAVLEKAISYGWVFYINAIMLFVLFFLTAYVYPYDAPAPAAPAGGPKSAKSAITMGTLLKRFDQASVSLVIFSVLYTYCQYESIISLNLEQYSGVDSKVVGYASMGQGIAFLLASIPLGMIPDNKKDFNKMLLIGALLLVFTQFLTGPIYPIPVHDPSSLISFYWAAAGLAVGGVAGCFILPYGMPALAENLVGVFPADQEVQVKNAQGSLLSVFFALGNFIGTLLGGFMSQTIFPTKECLKWDMATMLKDPTFKALCGKIPAAQKTKNNINCKSATLTQKALVMATATASDGGAFCSVTNAWKSSGSESKKDTASMGFDFAKAIVGKTLKEAKAIEDAQCWRMCKKGKAGAPWQIRTQFTPMQFKNVGWRMTYTIGFVVLCVVFAIQLFSVMFKQNPNKGKPAPANGTEMKHRSSLQLDDEEEE